MKTLIAMSGGVDSSVAAAVLREQGYDVIGVTMHLWDGEDSPISSAAEDAKKVLKYLHDAYDDDIFISIMNQYTIMDNLKYKELNQKVKDKDYNEIIDYMISLGIKNAFCQLDDTSSKKYIPDFDLEGV